VSEQLEDDDGDGAEPAEPAGPAEPLPSATEQALRAQLAEQRDDVALWTVLGDLLQSEDDPRGALVMLMLERERAPSPRLYETEQNYRAQHLPRLLPRPLRRHASAIAWRRGFPSGILVPTLGVLAQAIRAPSLAFVDHARLEVPVEEWEDWLAALDGIQLPWRRVRITIRNASGDDELELAPWLASMPAVEHLNLVCPEYEEGRISFTDVVAPHLRHIAIDNANEVVALENADLPALEELRFLVTSPVSARFFEGELCTRIKQLVVPDPGAVPRLSTGPAIVQHARRNDEDREWNESQEDAFIAIQQLVDAALIEEVAAAIKGFHRLIVETGHVVDGTSSFTVVRARGIGAAELMPYGLAVAIADRLAPATPIVLVHASERTGTVRGFSFGARPIRETTNDTRSAELVRALFDRQAGHDPGLDIFDDLKEALECARVTTLIGPAHSRIPVLTDIDPGTLGPLPELDDDFDEPIPEHELELYARPPDEPGAGEEPLAVETPSLAETVVELDHELAEEADHAADETSDDGHVDDSEDVELRTDTPPDGRDAWVRLLAEWAERQRDPDDEYADRWRDPELLWDAPFDWDKAAADTTCHSCEYPHVLLYACSWCGGQHCASCAVQVEGHGVWCARCITELAAEPSLELPDPRSATYDDEVFDTEPQACAVIAATEDSDPAIDLHAIVNVDGDVDLDEWA
jgi:hypothetical protein